MRKHQKRWIALAGAATLSVAGLVAAGGPASAEYRPGDDPLAWPVVRQHASSYSLDGFDIAYLPPGLERFGIHAVSKTGNSGERVSTVSWVQGTDAVYGRVSVIRSQDITDLDDLRKARYGRIEDKALQKTKANGFPAYMSEKTGDLFWVPEQGVAVEAYLQPDRWEADELAAFADGVERRTADEGTQGAEESAGAEEDGQEAADSGGEEAGSAESAGSGEGTAEEQPAEGTGESADEGPSKQEAGGPSADVRPAGTQGQEPEDQGADATPGAGKPQEEVPEQGAVTPSPGTGGQPAEEVPETGGKPAEEIPETGQQPTGEAAGRSAEAADGMFAPGVPLADARTCVAEKLLTGDSDAVPAEVAADDSALLELWRSVGSDSRDEAARACADRFAAEPAQVERMMTGLAAETAADAASEKAGAQEDAEQNEESGRDGTGTGQAEESSDSGPLGLWDAIPWPLPDVTVRL
ncbi:hypothetical protein [Streptomonospora arabica]|uniref:Uncharacterized protein n=1 Tax=Streptomonospora arabica TaxID=412417 RepID=A0ABV9SLM2_9ACTN